MADDVTITIDGIETTVPRGTTILKAAEAIGIEIPVFCYHDGLPIAANCRMCLVESNKHRTPIPACQVEVMPDMEVKTSSEVVLKARRGTLEFILLNHPVDCPICDQVGECMLQDHFYDHDLMPSRQRFRKVHKPKAVRIGPRVTYDGERCILCTRCVRFSEDVVGYPQLTTINRGNHSEITTFPGKELDHPYSLCTVDLCPVGALTSTDFRFKSRVYFLEGVDTHCTHCARGCAIVAQTKDGKVMRIDPRKDLYINRWWACDEGRLAFHAYEEERVVLPRRYDGIDRLKVPLDEALTELDTKLAEYADKLAVVVTPNLLDEDLHALCTLLGTKLTGAKLFVGSRPEGFQDDFLVRGDKHPNRAGLELVLEAHGVTYDDMDTFVAAVESGVIEAALVIDGDLDRTEALMAAVKSLELLAFVGSNRQGLADKAHVVIPTRTPFERSGSFVTVEGYLVKVVKAVDPPAGVEPLWKILGALAGQSYKTPSEVFGAMAQKVPAFAGMSLKQIDPLGVKLGGQS